MLDQIPAIAVLGPPDDGADPAVLAMAESVGANLARAGYVTLVLGENGVAAAARKGAARGKGRVVTVSADARAERDLSGEVEVAGTTLRAMDRILELADAAILLPGGLETLAILLQVWSFGSSSDGPYRQMILLGDKWRATINALADAANIDRRTRAMVSFAEQPDESVESLRYYIAP